MTRGRERARRGDGERAGDGSGHDDDDAEGGRRVGSGRAGHDDPVVTVAVISALIHQSQ